MITIVEWNIFLNALIAVLLVFYGVWFKNVVKHQLKSKDATIESLGAAIKANEAEISRLQGDSAPAIAEAYMKLKDFSEEMARKAQDQSNELEKAKTASEKSGDCSLAQRLTEQLNGFRAANNIWSSAIKNLQTGVVTSKRNMTTGDILDAMTQAVTAMSTWITANGEALRQARLEENKSK